MMIAYNITSASRVGCVRRQNEDMILVDNRYVRNGDYATQVALNHQDKYIVAVADGMGGHNRGGTSLLLLTVWVVITVEMWPAMTC